MINEHGVSHALILDDEEVGRLRSRETESVVRRTRTKLRMSVALLQGGSNSVIGLAELDDSLTVQEQDHSSVNEWVLRDVSWLSKPHRLSIAAKGPLWVRLPAADRTALRSVRDEAPPSGEPAEQEPHTHVGLLPTVEQNQDTESVFELDSAQEAEEADVSAFLVLEDEATSDGAVETAPVDDSLAVEAEEPVEDDAQVGDPTASFEAAIPDPTASAKARARRFIPQGAISISDARRILISLRDEEIKPAFPHVSAERGILRRAMLHALLEEGVASTDDYSAYIPEELRSATDAIQTAIYLDTIMEILSHIEDESGRSERIPAKVATRSGDGWTDAELGAAVASYARMLNCELAGIPYNKAAEIRELRKRELSGRSDASVTLRWQNISHLLLKAGRPFIAGFKPAANVGENIEKRLTPLLARQKLI